MNSSGFIENAICGKCGAKLEGEGDGRPAESYAGTYTGLCYSCTQAGAYAVVTEPSGAVRWSHPPHCPSWRRDREQFLGYEGCAECGGRGRIMVSRSDTAGGSFAIQCADCSHEHFNHPEIVRVRIRGLTRSIWMSRGQDEYDRRLKKLAKQNGYGSTQDQDRAIARQTISELPPEPKGLALAEFPAKWAKPGLLTKKYLAEYACLAEGC